MDQSDTRHLLSKLGRFELIEQLGAGSFGSVWLARDNELDRTVAIKVPRQRAMSVADQEQFFREARAAAQLRHPNIVSVHEVGRDGDTIYIVSDFVSGKTLDDWLVDRRITALDAATLCARIADALQHAHEQGVVHRDLKPANIMIDSVGEPHILDFGMARREVGEVTVTTDGQILGTPEYMSPEQAQGESHTADRRSDIYALGVVLFQLFTGELPFRGNVRMVIHQVIHDDPPFPRTLNGTISKDLETVTLKCLEKEPERRYQAAKDLGEELRRYVAGKPVHARPISKADRVWRWCRRHPAVAALSTSLVVGATVAFAVMSWQWFTIKQSQDKWIALQVERLATAPASEVGSILAGLHLVQQQVRPRLQRLLEDKTTSPDARLRARLGLLADDPQQAKFLIGAVLDEHRSVDFRTLIESVAENNHDYAVAELKSVVNGAPTSPESQSDAWAKQKAYAALALLQLGSSEPVWRAMHDETNPAVQSFFISRFKPTGTSPAAVAELLDKNPNVPLKRIAYLILGSFERNEVSNATQLAADALKVYEEDPHAALHSAARWLLTQWKFTREIDSVDALCKRRPADIEHKEWYVSPTGHTMVVRGPAEFMMGSPESEEGSDRSMEHLHPVRIDRTFAMCALEITVAQYQRFRKLLERQDIARDCPIQYVSWSDAAAYCNWLSSQEGLGADQLCYENDPLDNMFLRPTADCLNRQGYRLPTEAEWEYICRGGTTSVTFFGNSQELLSEYAWCPANSPGSIKRPVGRKLPNQFGVFDILGNALEWCGDHFLEYRIGGNIRVDCGGPTMSIQNSRVLRGSAVGDEPPYRSAKRDGAPEKEVGILAMGFRVARTIKSGAN
ncbi:MAG TPA: bifunctional serine/threonine-protein kinase/formylglycine-generating enzyme family protein [Lacipirellulaceae bacterium]|nr:bifunctional serine/threonine-protein kinase/formylglycine-generating enzyme family protein [Lacipirellulaceae bacterium]